MQCHTPSHALVLHIHTAGTFCGTWVQLTCRDPSNRAPASQWTRVARCFINTNTVDGLWQMLSRHINRMHMAIINNYLVVNRKSSPRKYSSLITTVSHKESVTMGGKRHSPQGLEMNGKGSRWLTLQVCVNHGKHGEGWQRERERRVIMMNGGR